MERELYGTVLNSTVSKRRHTWYRPRTCQGAVHILCITSWKSRITFPDLPASIHHYLTTSNLRKLIDRLLKAQGRQILIDADMRLTFHSKFTRLRRTIFRSRWLFSIAAIFLMTLYIYFFLGLNTNSNYSPRLSIPSPEVKAPSSISNYALLGLSHHILQRRAVRLTRESRYLVQSKLTQWREKLPSEEEFKDQVNEFLNVFSGLTDLLEVDVEGLARVDGAGAAQRNALQRLTDAFNAALNKLQNPTYCSKAKHLVVDFNKGCGFGCQIHHATHCFRLAIASGRVLHLRSDKLTYSEQGFVSVFQPLTKCPLPESESEVVNVLWGCSLQASGSVMLINN
ncbi:hypothetical protein ACTXT7_002282 [Hymenolepis weldensis]